MFAFCGVVNEVPISKGGEGSVCYGSWIRVVVTSRF